MKIRIPTIVVLCSLSLGAHAGMYSPSDAEVMGAIKPGALSQAQNHLSNFAVTQIKTNTVQPRPVQRKRVATNRRAKAHAVHVGTSAAPHDRFEQSDPNWMPSATSGAPEWVPLFDFVEYSTRDQTRNIPDVATPTPTPPAPTPTNQSVPVEDDGRPAPQQKSPPGDEPGKPEDTPPTDTPVEDDPPTLPPPVIAVDDVGPTAPPSYPPVTDVPPVVSVPEPGTATLLLAGLAAIGLRRRSKC